MPKPPKPPKPPLPPLPPNSPGNKLLKHGWKRTRAGWTHLALSMKPVSLKEAVKLQEQFDAKVDE